MTTTEQIRSQIDSVVKLIKKYCDDFDYEQQRYSKAKSEANGRRVSAIQLLQHQFDEQIRCFSDAKTNDLNYIASARREVAAFDAELERIYSRTKLQINPPVSKSFDAKDAAELLARIRENGFWAWLKKILAIGKYDKNSTMAADLYEKIDSAYLYFSQAAAKREKAFSDKCDAAKKQADKKRDIIEEQYRQEISNEETAHRNKVAELNATFAKIVADTRIVGVQQLRISAATQLGATNDGWDHYTPVKTTMSEVLLGSILYPCCISNPQSKAVSLLSRFSCYESKPNGFTIPLSIPFKHCISIYTECDDTDVLKAAKLYQSIVARMIRFMPLKSIRAFFIDPVNRGTALGSLIHLSGEGSSQVCKYFLSQQDIGKCIGALTEHVDNTCRRLTSSSCKDISVFNANASSGRIPYSILVIHDYPNGLDSSALSQLQVLINKAEQCGISILITHKSADKVEHRAQEVLNAIKKSFIQVQENSTGKYSIQYDGTTYKFRPNLCAPSDNYFTELNKIYTYKPPVDNRFMAHFGDGSVGTIRNANEGLDIPFAIGSNGELYDFRIGYDLSAHGVVSGGTGAGKTTLLHMLIASVIAHYSPSDVELWLIDYKETEFSFYMRNCPGHIRYIVADQSSEISYSMIDEIQHEIKRRNKLFNDAHVKDFLAYRKSPAQLHNPLARVLVIIDEFHRMAQAITDEPSYKDNLDNVFSEARSTGIALLLCDQQISTGLNGLSPRSRKLISARLAMRNDEEEIREVLAVGSLQLTDDLRKMIANTCSGEQGSLIYKYEIPNPDNPHSNKVVFSECRGIHATEKDRIECIKESTRRFSSFSREHVFFIGAKRSKMHIPSILNFEKEHPQNADFGNRFYIGTPLGIQPCFYFNLKPGEGGENVILAGSNHEKRLAIIKAIVMNAERYGYKITILASRAAQLFRQNRTFFESLSSATLVTAFSEICRYIGEAANKLHAMYDDEDGDYPDEINTSRKDLVIIIGVDEVYSQMEASSLTQKAAWNQSSAVTQSTSVAAIDSIRLGMDNDFPQFIKADSPMVLDPQKEQTGVSIDASLAAIEDLLGGLGEEIEPQEKMTQAITDKYFGVESTGIKGYNAVSDLSFVLSDGWKLGINAMIVCDRGTAFNKMRQIKLDGNFNHRIGLLMSPDEAQCFMSKTRTMKNLVESNDTISAVYEYLGGRDVCFRPYVFSEGPN